MKNPKAPILWKDIPGYESLYQVSDCGKVRRLGGIVNYKNGSKRFVRGRILKLASNTKGYRFVELSKENIKKTFLIHRLVASVFIPNTGNKPEVNHKNGNPSDNHKGNLEWSTRTENELHKIHSLNNKPQISNFSNVQHTDRVVQFNGKNIYGFQLQELLIRLMNGERLCLESIDTSYRQHFYSTIYELKKRFGVPIVSKRKKGLPSYKEYWIDLRDAGIPIEDELQENRFKIYFIKQAS